WRRVVRLPLHLGSLGGHCSFRRRRAMPGLLTADTPGDGLGPLARSVVAAGGAVGRQDHLHDLLWRMNDPPEAFRSVAQAGEVEPVERRRAVGKQAQRRLGIGARVRVVAAQRDTAPYERTNRNGAFPGRS